MGAFSPLDRVTPSHTPLALAELAGDGIDGPPLAVKAYCPFDLLLSHWLVPHLDAVLLKDLQEPALGQAVLLAQRVRGGARAVGVNQLGDGGR